MFFFCFYTDDLGHTEDADTATYCGWSRRTIADGASLFAIATDLHDNEFTLYYKTAGLEIHIGGGSGVQTGVAMSQDVWTHICVTYDSTVGDIELYLGGVSVFNHTQTANLPVRSSNSLICNTQEVDLDENGAFTFDANQAFVGNQAQFYFYTRVLDEAEVSLMFSGSISDGYLFSYEAFVAPETASAETLAFPLANIFETQNGDSLHVSSLSLSIYIYNTCIYTYCSIHLLLLYVFPTDQPS